METRNFITTIQVLLKDRNEEFEMANPQRIRLLRHKDNRNIKIIDGKGYKNSLERENKCYFKKNSKNNTDKCDDIPLYTEERKDKRIFEYLYDF